MTMGIAKIIGMPILLGAAAMTLGVLRVNRAALDAETVAPPALVGLTLRDAPRCPHCGWIESKREISPLSADAQAPASYEYTARMRDGSRHVFREEMPASWRLGERLIFIEGSDPLD
jgi:hypothetical protein